MEVRTIKMEWEELDKLFENFFKALRFYLTIRNNNIRISIW